MGKSAHARHQLVKSQHQWQVGGALLGGLLASSCCVIQLVFNLLSLGCAGFAVLDVYRPLFLTITGILVVSILFRQGLTWRTLLLCGTCVLLAHSNTLVSAYNEGQLTTMFTWLLHQTVKSTAPLSTEAEILINSTVGDSIKTASVNHDVGATVFPPQQTEEHVVVLSIQGMKCEGCAANLKRKILQLPGVLRCTVNFAGKQVTVQWDTGHQTIQGVISVIQHAGYGVEVTHTTEPTGN